MNIASILLLLQLAVQLLSAPNMTLSQKTQAMSFANQAVSLAVQALNQPASTQIGSVVTTTPELAANLAPVKTPEITSIYIPPQTPIVAQGTADKPQVAIGAPDLASVSVATVTPTPSCVLSARIDSLDDFNYPLGYPGPKFFHAANVALSWTLNNVPNLGGTLDSWEIDHLTGKFNEGHLISISAGQTTQEHGFMPIYKLVFGGATCYTFFPDYRYNSSTLPNINDTSTPIEPSSYSYLGLP